MLESFDMLYPNNDPDFPTVGNPVAGIEMSIAGIFDPRTGYMLQILRAASTGQMPG